MIKIFIILTTFFTTNNAIIGFDCGSTIPNITTFSLLDSGECEFHEPKINSTNVTIELIQLAEFRTIQVQQCKIEIHRTIFSCGMFGHLIPTENAQQEYIYDISHEKCKFIHESGIFKYDNTHTIADLKVNSTVTKGIDFAGSASGNTCSGETYSDNFGTWNKVFVQGTIKITLIEINAQVSLNNDKLRLPSGTACKFSDEHCIDMEGGHTFWSILAKDQCFKNSYDVLYKGRATKFTNELNHEIIYTLHTDEITFALTAKDSIIHCNREFIKTEHPKLLIYEKTRNQNIYYFDNDINIERYAVNLDLYTYVNSKFVYVEKHIRTQLDSLYLNLITHRCNMERNIIQNSLSLATLSPDEFAYNIMKKPGYIAKVAGEVVHLIKCTPKNVKIIHSEACFTQLPVLSGNETWFLTPRTHILVKNGNQIDCNPIIPTQYKINDEWIKFIPKPSKTESPNEFKPHTKITWTYKSADSLATSGVYSQEDLDKLQKHLMFPLEKASLLNNIAREMTGEHSIQDDSIKNLLNENTLTHIAENTWHKFIEKLTSFGSISAAIIMVLIILHIIKLIIDTIIQGYTLHAIYGFSLHLLGALFSSITHLLINLGRKNTENDTRPRKNKKKREDFELKEVIIEPTSISRPIQPPPLPIRPPALKPDPKPTQISKPKNNIGIFSLETEY